MTGQIPTILVARFSTATTLSGRSGIVSIWITKSLKRCPQDVEHYSAASGRSQVRQEATESIRWKTDAFKAPFQSQAHSPIEALFEKLEDSE